MASAGWRIPSGVAYSGCSRRLAKAVQSVNSDDVQPCIGAICRDVCSVCYDRAKDGSCQQRQESHCALDPYLLPVVDAIEEATGRRLNRQLLGLAGGIARPGLEMRL